MTMNKNSIFHSILKFKKQNVKFNSTKSSLNSRLKKLYRILGVPENCKDEDLRLAFVQLAKRFHPDSGTSEACSSRFTEIESAYREIQSVRQESGQDSYTGKTHSEIVEHDIQHTAPQHRHYLMYDMGTGTLGQRQRRYTASKAQRAAENVMEHRLKSIQAVELNTLVGKDKQRAKDIKTRYGMDRLVEDLIQEAMNKGEFTNLQGAGKPLKENRDGQNPYVDFVTHKLNQVLIDNGFIPEWIQLFKDIRQEIEDLKKKLREVRREIGDVPLSLPDEQVWNQSLKNLQNLEKQINFKIDRYNLLVPILQKQMVQINLKTLSDNVLNEPRNLSQTKTVKQSNISMSQSQDSMVKIINVIFSVFKK